MRLVTLLLLLWACWLISIPTAPARTKPIMMKSVADGQGVVYGPMQLAEVTKHGVTSAVYLRTHYQNGWLDNAEVKLSREEWESLLPLVKGLFGKQFVAGDGLHCVSMENRP